MEAFDNSFFVLYWLLSWFIPSVSISWLLGNYVSGQSTCRYIVLSPGWARVLRWKSPKHDRNKLAVGGLYAYLADAFVILVLITFLLSPLKACEPFCVTVFHRRGGRAIFTFSLLNLRIIDLTAWAVLLGKLAVVSGVLTFRGFREGLRQVKPEERNEKKLRHGKIRRTVLCAQACLLFLLTVALLALLWRGSRELPGVIGAYFF